MFSGKTRNKQPILSLSVEKASVEQKLIALKILSDWEINAVVKWSTSENCEVIRIQGKDCEKLDLAKFLCNPNNWTTHKNDKDNKSCGVMDISIEGLEQERVTYIQNQLKRLAVRSEQVINYSYENRDGRKGVDVLRIMDSSINRLKSTISLFYMVDSPLFPEETHYRDRQKDGSVIIRKKEEGCVGKIDNPLGPAVIRMDGSFYYKEGIQTRFNPIIEEPDLLSSPLVSP